MRRRGDPGVVVAGRHVSDFPRQAALLDAGADQPPADAIRAGSNKPVWWRCPEGPDHVWQAAPNVLVSNDSGCPFCAGKRVSVTNRLDLCFSEVAAEWDVELNDGRLPSQVVHGRQEKVWWRCRANPTHTWQALINQRTRLASGCPRCAAEQTARRLRVPAPGRSLAEARPDLVAEWDAERNGRGASEVAALSNDPAWWVCSAAGHSWRVSPAVRVGKGTGCPKCSGRDATPSNDLNTRPDLVAEFDLEANAPLTPADITVATAAKVAWVCAAGHRWTARVANRSLLGRACPYCTGQRVGQGNDLATVNPDLAAQWHPHLNGDLTPADVTPGENRKVWWLCGRGHAWQAQIGSRTQGVGCPVCASGWQRSRPEVALETELGAWLGTDVDGHAAVVAGGRRHQVDVLLRKLRAVVEYDGAHWHAGQADLDASKTADLTAGGWAVVRVREQPLALLGETCVAVPDDPDLVEVVAAALTGLLAAARSDPGSPLAAALPRLEQAVADITATPALRDPDRYQARVAELFTRTARPPGPRVASPARPGRSLTELFPAVAAEWDTDANDGREAATIAAASNIPAWWRCSYCGNQWLAPPAGRTRHGGFPGCPDCARTRGGAARRERRAPQAEAVMRAAGLEPKEPYPGSKKRWACQCSACGAPVSAVYQRVRVHGHTCRACRQGGQTAPVDAEAVGRAATG